LGKKRGEQSMMFSNPPVIASTAIIGGPMEGDGLLASYFDRVLDDNISGEASWERCESRMLEWVISAAVEKTQFSLTKIDYILAGDLLNQLMATHFAMRNVGRPFLGIYGACSTMAESLLLGAVLLDGGFGQSLVAAVSSHHDAAERQYRFPTELGVQRPKIAQWTVTGAGAAVIANRGDGPKLTAATVGKVIDPGIDDPNAMGPAMAPAAADTLWRHFNDTGRQPDYYDMIYTGDLGAVGKLLLEKLLAEKGVILAGRYEDCGCMIYRPDQDSHSGASGCASSALALCGRIFKQLLTGELRRILLVGTGSLHSPTSYQQKETIPCIAHAVAIEV
jgi:stage V sporulation protein AD